MFSSVVPVSVVLDFDEFSDLVPGNTDLTDASLTAGGGSVQFVLQKTCAAFKKSPPTIPCSH